MKLSPFCLALFAAVLLLLTPPVMAQGAGLEVCALDSTVLSCDCPDCDCGPACHCEALSTACAAHDLKACEKHEPESKLRGRLRRGAKRGLGLAGRGAFRLGRGVFRLGRFVLPPYRCD